MAKARSRTRKPQTTEQIVWQEFNNTAGDLAMACQECDSEPEIHVDDFMDQLCGSGLFGTYEEWDAKRDEIRTAVCKLLSPNDEDMIYIG
jgi:hypothetical protein